MPSLLISRNLINEAPVTSSTVDEMLAKARNLSRPLSFCFLDITPEPGVLDDSVNYTAAS